MKGLEPRPTGKDIAPQLDVPSILAAARNRAGLIDYGDDWFLQPLHHFVTAVNSEAQLTATGTANQFDSLVNALVNRLRMVEDLRLHPEILDEQVDVAGIILGLPRTGSTILQKVLASAPGMTTVRWFEGANYARFPGEDRGDGSARRAAAQAIIDGWLAVSPEMESQHPMFPDAPAEEIMILGQLFVSTLMEGTAYVPSFAAWLDGYDQSRGHEDLKTILQYLQWQDPTRRTCKWILKSPSHLPYLKIAARAFPEAVLIMTHRDPVDIVPSCASMMTSLYRLGSDIGEREVSAFWFKRLQQWMERFEEARGHIGEERFIDVRYTDFMRNPVAQAVAVLSRMGLAIKPEITVLLDGFMAANSRDRRPAHDYSLARFGLGQQEVERAFASYRARYLGRAQGNESA